MKTNKILLEIRFLLPALIAGLSLMLTGRVTAQTYTFGPQVQSTPSASITNNSGTGTFQYTDTANSTEDYAYLPLTGNAATFITTTNGWTASINVNIFARSMTVGSGNSAHVVMGLIVVSGNIGNNGVFIFSGQDNNTGGGDDQIYPDGWYGTAIRFGALTNGVENATMALGNSLPSSNGSVYLPLSGGTSASAGTESFSDVTGVLTLNYTASTETVTGYYNGTPVGSYSLASWGPNPPLTLAVWGGSGSGVAVPAGTDTGNNVYAAAQGTAVFPIANNGIASQAGIFAAFGGTNYLVGIQGDGTANNTNITAQLISSNGTLVGSRILVGRTGGIPYVAFGGTNFLLVWSDDALVAGGGNDQFYGQFISRSGALVGSPFTFGPTSEEQDMQGGGGSPLAFDGRDFLAVWDTGAFHDAPSGDVHGALFSQTGSLVVPTIDITSGAIAALTPAVTFGKTNYLVVWNNRRSGDTELYDIYGEFISTNGTHGTAFAISQTPTPSYNPCCAAFDGTNFMVVWNKDIGLGYPNPTIWNLYGRLVSPSGTFPGNEVAMVTDTNSPEFPSLASDGANYLLAWNAGVQSTNSQIVFHFFNQSASPVGPEFNLFSLQGTNAPLFGGVLFDGNRFEITAVVGGAIGISSSGIDFTTGTGAWGTFLSRSTASPTLTANNRVGTQFSIQLTGTPGINYAIQVSTNLAVSNWMAVVTNSPTNGTFSFVDTNTTNKNRFYRAVIP